MSNSEIALLVETMRVAEDVMRSEGWLKSAWIHEQWASAFDELNKFYSPLEIFRMVKGIE